TGRGKSICFTVPSIVQSERSLTIVILPTLSLIQDQYSSLLEIHIPTAQITGSTKWSAFNAIREDLKRGYLQILLVTPERLGLPSFRNMLLHIQRSAYKKVQMVINEVHLSDQWDDFGDYDHIQQMKSSNSPMRMHGSTSIPTLVLTATVTR
ncbi:P-loop containing nucleoside triphosphate hydrolase protein, partial [Phlyctochytrium arcticum]